MNNRYDADGRPERSPRPTRREILAGSAGLVGASLLGALTSAASARVPARVQTTSNSGALPQGVATKNGGTKPIYVAAEGVDDPVAHSIADTLFWTDILSEHGMFFAMLMPGPELAGPRAQAEQFQQRFAAHFAKARAARLDRSGLAAFNRETIDLVKPFVDFKHQMRAEQQAGTLKSLVWPLFFDHTAREAERFARRLDALAKGDSALDPGEVVDFWTQIMAEHADFIAHLLDPQEQALVDKAMKTSRAFHQMHGSRPASKAPVTSAANDIIDFKTAAAKGIEAGQIKSIIHPALADHVRREAVKFADELKRTA